ncbi:MAG: tetratricopeptide repeat protein [Methylacidiphilales bacterium]|nr:tetratricopeptide repeat protein [Candidatus Methylacidiphilales bacterium]
MTRFLLAVFLLLMSGLASQVLSETSPQDQYLQIYLLIQEAEKLELAGQKASARERYTVSQDRLEKLPKDWEPTIVNYRIRYCKDKIEKLADAKDENPSDNVPPIPPDLGTTPPAQPAPAPAQPAPAALAPTIETPSSTNPSNASDDPAVLKKRINDLESQLSDTKERLEQAQLEAATLRTKVTELEAAVKSAREGTPDEKVTALMEENRQLKEKLVSAETLASNLQNGSSPESLTTMQEQLKKIQDQLELAKQENTALRQTSDEYKKKMEEAQKNLDDANAKLAAIPKDNPLQKENSVLRDILKREMAEQTRREVAKRIAMEELEGLAIDSEKLKTQITLLGSPLIQLSPEEKDLLKEPAAVALETDNSGNFSMKKDDLGATDYSTRPKVPPELKDTAKEANDLFAQQKFDDAAAKYQSILNAYPDSLYALSNLGVVRFQQGKYALAEEFLRKAVKQAPQDAFSHSILGIALYQQGKYDDAVQILTRAVALEPNDPKTHNYLGISASQKGWQEAAEQECRKAIELDPQYGDAHFNLAVIYSTQRPPSRELARRHYERALELGVPRDPQLEKLVYSKEKPEKP